MNTFGKVKSKILNKITESYVNQNKKEVKNIFDTIKKNKDFKELYLLYEDIENKYIKDKDIAKFYVDELTKSLNGRYKNVKNICKKIDKSINLNELNNNPIYDILDNLMEEDNLLNIENKLKAKNDLFNHLITEKNKEIESTKTIVENEKLLHAILANNFNLMYSNTLDENERKEFKEIMSLNENELKIKTIELKNTILSQINNVLNESKDVDLTQKLIKVKEEVHKMEPTKYSFFKLKELKNGLN